MSTLQVANVLFESTGNNRIHLPSTNTMTIVVAGANVVAANTSTTTLSIGATTTLFSNSTTNLMNNGNTVVGPGSFSPGYRLYVNGTVYATGDITALSDLAMKTDIHPITGALDIVGDLQGVHYKMKDSGQDKIGLIAQEVKKVLPEVVVESGEHMGIAYQNMVAVLIEAVKELKKKVEDLENR